MGKKRVSKAAVPPPPVDPVPEQDKDEIVDEAVLSPSRTNEIISPVQCAVLGLDTGRVKSSLSFTIESRTEDGARVHSGGGAFFVAIRGAARVRARVFDNLDGTYRVEWSPPLSGEYNISVSLFGVAIDRSPYRVRIHGGQPHAPSCSVRGEALHNITSRATWSFEIRYRDKTGGVAPATALDVFVVPEAAYLLPELEDDRTGADESGGGERAAEMRPPSAWEAATGGEKQNMEAVALVTGGSRYAPRRVGEDETQGTGAEEGEGTSRGDESADGGEEEAGLEAEQILMRTKADRVEIGRHPLIVRASADLDSEQLGTLLPGERITIVEERMDAGGQHVRACVTFAPAALKSAPAVTSTDGSGVTAVDAGGGEVSEAGGSATSLSASVRGGGAASRFDPKALATEVRSSASLTTREERRLAEVGGGYAALDAEGARLKEQRAAVVDSSGDPAATTIQRVEALGGGRVKETTLVAHNGAMERMGWVSIKKEGKRLVRYHWRMQSTERLDYMDQWRRRQTNNSMKYSVQSEVSNDEQKIGFAFGGVHPGWLHSKGQAPEVHKVSYSIGRVGRYLLHVRLRQAAAPIPGSPFALTVRPGPANARASKLPDVPMPLCGVVGKSAKDGCQIVLQTHDEIGNASSSGGAHIANECKMLPGPGEKKSDVEGVMIDATVTDRGDGTYLLEWRSERSGLFSANITINNEPVGGSPVLFSLTSYMPELGKTELDGPGLHAAVAGQPQIFRIHMVDAFGNPCRPDPTFRFGVAMEHETKKKMKVADVRLATFEGRWLDDQRGTHEISLIPTASGNSELHVWADPSGSGERLPLNGSPFMVPVTPGKPTAHTSFVDGYAKDIKNQELGKKKLTVAEQKLLEQGSVTAGDTVTVRPVLLDAYGNGTTLGEDEQGLLTSKVVMPDGSETTEMPVVFDSVRKRYEARMEMLKSGEHQLHVMLGDASIKGAPRVHTSSVPRSRPTPCSA